VNVLRLRRRATIPAGVVITVVLRAIRAVSVLSLGRRATVLAEVVITVILRAIRAASAQHTESDPKVRGNIFECFHGLCYEFGNL
jgi:DNA-binding NarL/FixJ family response regulator